MMLSVIVILTSPLRSGESDFNSVLYRHICELLNPSQVFGYALSLYSMNVYKDFKKDPVKVTANLADFVGFMTLGYVGPSKLDFLTHVPSDKRADNVTTNDGESIENGADAADPLLNSPLHPLLETPKS